MERSGVINKSYVSSRIESATTFKVCVRKSPEQSNRPSEIADPALPPHLPSVMTNKWKPMWGGRV